MLFNIFLSNSHRPHVLDHSHCFQSMITYLLSYSIASFACIYVTKKSIGISYQDLLENLEKIVELDTKISCSLE